MKVCSASMLALGLFSLAPNALGFVPSPPTPTSVQVKLQESMQTMQPQMQATKSVSTIITAVASVLLGIGLSSQAAFAAHDVIPTTEQLSSSQQYYYDSATTTSRISSSTVVLAEIEKFTLPSYDTSKGSVLIDISNDLDTVNKKTLTLAKERREKTDTSLEKIQADQMRQAEKDGSALLDSLLGESDLDRKARIEAEKAESRANRWKTF